MFDSATVSAVVYSITCPVGAYIGSTQQRWSQRKAEHLSRLRKGKHESRALQAAWDKHGEAAFEFAVLEVVADEERAAAEDKHIRARRDSLNRKSAILLPRNISGARRIDARVRDLLGPDFRERLVEARSLDNSVTLLPTLGVPGAVQNGGMEIEPSEATERLRQALRAKREPVSA